MEFEVIGEVSKTAIMGGIFTTYNLPDGKLYWTYANLGIYVEYGGKYYRIKIPDGITMYEFVNSYDGNLFDILAFKIL